MQGNVGSKWKAGVCRHQTGCSTCKSSPREAISVVLKRPTTKSGGMWKFLYTPSTLLSSEDHAMGKTLTPFSSLIEQERRRWMPFKKMLPKADQALFDRLFDCAKLHIQARVM